MEGVAAQSSARLEAKPPSPEVEVVSDLGAVSKMLKPLRLEILKRLNEPASASGLARQLGLPRQRLNYHLRELERAGLLRCVEERGKGNCVERLYRASAQHFMIGPEALGRVAPPDPDPVPSSADRASWSFLVSLLAKALRQLGGLRRAADRAGQRLATVGLQSRVGFQSPAALAEFSERLTTEVARLVAEYHDETAGSRSYEIFLGSYPTPAGEEETP
jgi:DNA-binding transcriptional ArsR family regulator